MNRSRSKSRLLETAFVSQSRSSTEDLDEVDRLANHPMLRPSPVPETYTLGSRRCQQNRSWRPFRSSMRKSRSEMGGYGSDTGGGFSIALSQPILDGGNAGSCQSSAALNRKENSTLASSYTPPAEFGCRTVAVGMMRGNGSRVLRGNLSRMKRSTTINFQQFYSSQTSEDKFLDNLNSNVIQNKNVSNSASSISSFHCDNIKNSNNFNLRNSPSSSYWSNWTGEDENERSIGDTDIKYNTGVNISNPNQFAPSCGNKLIRDENNTEHQTVKGKVGEDMSRDSVLVVTSAVVEYQSSSHSASGDLIRSNNGLKNRSPTTITSPPMYTNHSNLDGISQVERNSGFTSRSPKGAMVSKQKEVHWNQETISSQDSSITKNASSGKNISPIIPKQCEINVSPASKLNVDNMTTTDTTGSYRSSASNIDVSSTSMPEEGGEKNSSSDKGLHEDNVNQEGCNLKVNDDSVPENTDTYRSKLSLGNLISPPLQKFRLLPISLAHRRIKGNERSRRATGKKLQDSKLGIGSTPSNSSSADSTPQKNRLELKTCLKPSSHPVLRSDGHNLRQFARSLEENEDGIDTSLKHLDAEGNIKSIQGSPHGSEANVSPSQNRLMNITNSNSPHLTIKDSIIMSKEQLLKPPAPPRPKRAIVMKKLLLERKQKEKRNSLFASGTEDENESDEEESCSFVSSLESMKSIADSGGSTSDGIQSLVSSAESGVAALANSSAGTGCGVSLNSNSSSATDLNIPQLSRDRTPNKPHFKFEQRSSGFLTSKSNVISRQFVVKSSPMDMRQYHNSMIRPLLSSSKFPVLSPISDKSQEQCPSEIGESQPGSITNNNTADSASSHNKTPKVSPTEQILAACCVGGSRVEETDGIDDVTFVSFKHRLSNPDIDQHLRSGQNPASLRNTEEGEGSLYAPETQSYTSKDKDQFVPAPFSMPKLERRLQQERQKQKHSHNMSFGNKSVVLTNMYNNNNKGSDSGISMAGSSSHGGYSGESSNEQGTTGASASAQDMFQLLQELPFDMPKLRRKTQEILSSKGGDKNNISSNSTSSSASPFLTRLLPPRPNSVPNQTTGPFNSTTQQFHPNILSYELESEQKRYVRNESENYSSPRRIEQSNDISNCPSVGGVRNTSNLKTRGEIYQQFADQNEINNTQNLSANASYSNHNNENNNHQTDQDLHFAKRLTWNLNVDDKMQTSTDGIETPNIEHDNESSPPSSLYNQVSRPRPNFPGATSNSSNQWDNGQMTNRQYQVQSNQTEASELLHSRSSNLNGNSIHSLRNTFQLNFTSDNSNNSQTNVPKHSNNATSNLNLNILQRTNSSYGWHSFEESSTRVVNPQNIAPPPPGFEDNDFYLTETQPIAQENAKALTETPPNFKQGTRRQRPKMTLSFAGLDSPLSIGSSNQVARTLMFATNSPFPLNDCKEIDPNLSLERQDWYHGSITRNEAEDMLRNRQEGSYLVRNVDSIRQEYALCLKSALGYMHMRIRRDAKDRNFQLSDFNRRFITIPEMIHHYTLNRLPIKGAEHMCLKTPVPMQLL